MSRLAGSDTREASASRTVLLASRLAFLVGGFTLAATLGFGWAWRHALDRSIPLPVLLASLAAAISGISIWRASRRHLDRGDPSVLGASPLFAIAAFTGALAFGGQERLLALLLPALIVVGAGVLADACAMAAAAVPAASRSAAIGITLSGGLAGVIPAVHLSLVAAGAGLPRAAAWTAAEALLAAPLAVAVRRALADDRRRVERRPRAPAIPQALSMRAAVVAFGANEVLRGADLDARAGEVVALVGGNGSGKSTLLRVAAGIHRADEGRAWLAGDDITMLRADERAAAGLAFASGARPVFPDLSVEQNLRCASYRTHRGPDHADATDALLRLVPTLQDRRRAKAGVLSGGEQRLLAVISTLYRRPAVLLADELTLGLDMQARAAVLDLLRALADDGMAVVAVDHDLVALLARADRAELLHEGKLISFDDPREVLEARADLLPAIFLAGVQR